MNLHLMLILLSFTQPQHQDLDLMIAPQVVAPISMFEYKMTWKEFLHKQDLKRKLKERV